MSAPSVSGHGSGFRRVVARIPDNPELIFSSGYRALPIFSSVFPLALLAVVFLLDGTCTRKAGLA
ncbi:MAG: hypothetical protein AB7D33_08540 [Sphingobium sp.]